ncbi:MAG: glycosyltransferase family 39 protein [Bacteroidetes bacterium]|nr:glycosyltransferase family 39 protein [Bacteroidota bacterium]
MSQLISTYQTPDSLRTLPKVVALNPFLSRYHYYFLFALLGLVYFIGLFVPLMDNDSAHHANIALHMHLTGDYVSLIDNGKDYLDKPHFHFWLVALSYKLFGVSTFAYKFPSLLFTIGGIYSTFRLGKLLYDAETGRLAALILAAAASFILANNDVRMDAVLTACVAFATWQLIALIHRPSVMYAAGAALGLAMGFSTKGHIGIIIPGVAAIAFIITTRSWKIFLSRYWWLMLFSFAILIIPELYCYYQQFNLHPEITVRGRDHINGIQFILFGQSTERFNGEHFGSVNGNDRLFFIHTFLWAFAPWSILSIWSIVNYFRRKSMMKYAWVSLTPFIILFLILTFSGFKLPHYLNVIFPATAVLTASFIIHHKDNLAFAKWVYRIQFLFVSLLLALTLLLAALLFPVQSAGIVTGIILFLSVIFYFIKTKMLSPLQKAVTMSVAVMALVFFCLNAQVYPRMLRYQGGNELAALTRGKVDPADVYNWKDEYSSSYNFYTPHLTGRFHDSLLLNGKKIWLLYDEKFRSQIEAEGFQLRPVYAVPSYRISQPGIRFLDPATRDSVCSKMVLAEISRK